MDFGGFNQQQSSGFTTFAELAKKADQGEQNLAVITLSEYGPPSQNENQAPQDPQVSLPSIPAPLPPLHPPLSAVAASRVIPSIRLPGEEFESEDETNSASRQPPSLMGSSGQLHDQPTRQPAAMSRPTNPPQNLHGFSSLEGTDRSGEAPVLLNHSDRTTQCGHYSSTPLDEIQDQTTQHVTSSNSRAAKGPTPSSAKAATTQDDRAASLNDFTKQLDNMNMIQLQQKYRYFEALMNRNQAKRDEVERYLNDLARSAQGKNIDLDPEYREKQEQKEKCREYANEYRARMDKIKSKLQSKFTVNIGPKTSQTSTSSASRKRAKMSTATSTTLQKPVKSQESKLNRLTLHLEDDFIWCKSCDSSFTSLQDFCEHLHKIEHIRTTKRVTPWRKVGERVDVKKTYDIIKSICQRVANELEPSQQFTTVDLDYALNGRMTDKSSLKSRSLSRERLKFEKNDSLFRFKGYDHLIPIKGYYCQLCSIALCDNVDVEQHLKSHSHNYTHAKNVALNPEGESAFRTKLIKARVERDEESTDSQEQQESLSSTSHSPRVQKESREAIIRATTPSAASRPKPSDIPKPPAQYKKKTSHIVDQHDICKDKFDVTILPATAQRTHNNEGPQGSDLNEQIAVSSCKEVDSAINRHRDVEIVPLGDRSRMQPAALKRLKRTSIDERPPKKTFVNEESKEDEQQPPKEAVDRREEEDDEEEEEIDRAVDISDLEEDDIQALDDDHEQEITNKTIPNKDTEALVQDENIQLPVTQSNESCLPRNHPDSPYPELDLFVTGNIHLDVLKDQRLKSSRVVLNRVKLEDYRHMLLESKTLWERVNRMVMKKEDSSMEELLNDRRSATTKATYFDASGEPVPVELDGEC